jgi:predicted TIM-barrel fold metal-dependent hydrolase
MTRGWRAYLGKPGSMPLGAGAIPVTNGFPYHNPNGDYRPQTAGVAGQPPGSDPATVRKQLLDTGGPAVAILSHDLTMFTASIPNAYLAHEIVRAANDWCVDRWLTTGDGFYSLVLAPTQVPEQAAVEIRRVSKQSRFVGVLLAANTLGKPFGHPVYHPIYEAAVESDLPIVIHVGGDSSIDVTTHPTAGGLPLTFGEYSALAPTALMHHVVSLIAQGVFARFPGLRVLLVGSGTAWFPGLMWRFDMDYKALRREVPWLTAHPTDVFREHVRLCTYPIDRPPEEGALSRLLATFDGVENLLCYGSGHPLWNSDSVEEVARLFPESWHGGIFSDNALRFFRWPSASGPAELVPSGS